MSHPDQKLTTLASQAVEAVPLRQRLMSAMTLLLLVVVIGLGLPGGATIEPRDQAGAALAADTPTTPIPQSAGSAKAGALTGVHSYDDTPVFARGDGSAVFSGSLSYFSATNAGQGAVDAVACPGACGCPSKTPVIIRPASSTGDGIFESVKGSRCRVGEMTLSAGRR